MFDIVKKSQEEIKCLKDRIEVLELENQGLIRNNVQNLRIDNVDTFGDFAESRNRSLTPSLTKKGLLRRNLRDIPVSQLEGRKQHAYKNDRFADLVVIDESFARSIS